MVMILVKNGFITSLDLRKLIFTFPPPEQAAAQALNDDQIFAYTSPFLSHLLQLVKISRTSCI